MTNEELVEDFCSGNTQRILKASSQIISMAQESKRVKPFISYLPLILEKTKGLDLGGGFAPNSRFLSFAIRIIEFHRDSKACPCNLYSGSQDLDPVDQDKKGWIQIFQKTYFDNGYLDFYLARCSRCGQNFKIIEREYHFTWWGWEKITR